MKGPPARRDAQPFHDRKHPESRVGSGGRTYDVVRLTAPSKTLFVESGS
jgi:hypothetical protein